MAARTWPKAFARGFVAAGGASDVVGRLSAIGLGEIKMHFGRKVRAKRGLGAVYLPEMPSASQGTFEGNEKRR
jgi:hypothetical protein